MATDQGAGISAITSPTPTGPLAIPQLIRGEDGLMHTIYVDARTGQPLQTLNGYTILSGNNYYQPQTTSGTDNSKEETDKNTKKALGIQRESGGEKQDSYHGKPNTDPMDNYGYEHKPGGLKYASYLPGGLGLVGRAVNAGWNLNNYGAVTTARSMLGLPDTGLKGAVKGTLKDSQGQVSNNAQIGDKSYHIGFEALSPDGKTNLTPTEANNRRNLVGGVITEDGVPNDPTADNSGLGSRVAKATGVEKGWATKALDKLFGLDKTDPTLPDTAPTPTARSMVEAQSNNTSGTFGTKSSSQPAQGLISHPNKPSTNDPLGRVNIKDVDFGKIGLDPNMAARMKDFQKEAIAQGLDLSVDVSNTRRTPEQQAAIVDAGNSKTQNSYHLTGFAVDVSPTQVDAQGRILDQATLEKSRALATKYGFGLLDPSWDPAHIQAQVPGANAKQLAAMPQDPFGNVKLSPEQALGVRQNSVPTPTARPDPTSSVNNPVGSTLSPTQHQNIFEQIGPQASLGASITAQNVQKDTGQLTSAQAAAMGFTTRTPAERQQIATAIAGELSQQSLAGLTKNDPAAKAEVANMMAAIENRAASKMFSTLGATLAPSQVNSMMPENMKTTNQNYANNQKALDAAVQDFYAGKLTPTDWSKSSWYNPNAADPSWGPQMADPEQVGAHLFGSLPEYGPNKNEAARLDRISKDLSATDSPSESGGARFGGSGLGTPGNKDSGLGVGGATSGTFGGSSGAAKGTSSGGLGVGANASGTFGGSKGLGISGSTSGGLGTTGKSSSGTSLGGGANTNGQGSASKGSQSRSEGWF